MAIRVLVVDDSAFMRKIISEILNEQPDIEVVSTARNGKDALEKLKALAVDVITLDVEMPIMDGIEALTEIMATNPKPVLLLSSVTKKGSDITMKALSLGALDFIPKPSGSISLDLRKISDELVEKVRAAVAVNASLLKTPTSRFTAKRKTALKPQPTVLSPQGNSAQALVIIGSSTGGPKAVEEVFSSLPDNLRAGIVVVQHMPQGFTRSFAERLNTLFPLTVKEGQQGDSIENGKAIVAPGGFHLVIEENKQITLNQEPPVQFLRPAIDVTMLSIPASFSHKVVGVILTGMGKDGARGMAHIKQLGGYTIAQDRATSTIYSMPRVVSEQGHADYVLPLDRIGESIVKLVNTFY